MNDRSSIHLWDPVGDPMNLFHSGDWQTHQRSHSEPSERPLRGCHPQHGHSASHECSFVPQDLHSKSAKSPLWNECELVHSSHRWSWMAPVRPLHQTPKCYHHLQ